MATNLLIGGPGGGKSYEATRYHIIPALEKGRKVITNLPLNVDLLVQVYPEAAELLVCISHTTDENFDLRNRVFSKRSDYGDTWRHPETGTGPLYVIDEAHECIPRKCTKSGQAQELVLIEEWFARHRHESADVLLITQSYGKISKAVVDLVQLVFRVRKNTAFGSQKTYTRKVQDGIRGEVVNTAVRKYDLAYCKYYDSYTAGGGDEAMAQDVRPIWFHWTFIGAALMVLLSIGLFTYFSPSLLGVSSTPTTTPVNKQINTTSHQPVSSQFPIMAAVDNHKPQLEVNEVKKSSEVGEPLGRYQLHLSGLLGNEHLFNLSSNGQIVTTIMESELRFAGYSIEFFSHCMAKVGYKNIDSELILCDSPSVSINPSVSIF